MGFFMFFLYLPGVFSELMLFVCRVSRLPPRLHIVLYKTMFLLQPSLFSSQDYWCNGHPKRLILAGGIFIQVYGLSAAAISAH